MQKRTFFITLTEATFAAGALYTWAQVNFPDQPVKLIVPYPAGGGTDFFVRTIPQTISEALGQRVVVDDRAGASGMIGGQYVAKIAPADGYTVQ